VQHGSEGRVVADCGTFQTERGDNGGLTVHDGNVTMGIINFGKRKTLADLAGIRSSFCRNVGMKSEFGRRFLPECEFSAGTNKGFKYTALGANGRTVGVGYILEVSGGCVVVQIGTDAESFDELKYEESVLASIRIE
jgi:hypothetical protein